MERERRREKIKTHVYIREKIVSKVVKKGSFYGTLTK